MNWLVYHIVSGHAFFSGIGLLIVGVLASLSDWPICRRFVWLLFLIGAVAILISSTPIPYWSYGVAIAVTLIWIASQFKPAWRRTAGYATVVAWLFAALFEIPYHRMPSIRWTGHRTLTIIGDSVTAGLDEGESSETWPSILAREHHVTVQDISHVGETAASALKRARSVQITSNLVLVEIGGNDILGSTTPTQFASDLDGLLAFLSAPDRQIVMFELPIPPFYHEYGRVQRAAAARHHVSLVPKRVFLSVIGGNHATLDTIHLSPSGHACMADYVWGLLRSAF